MTNACRLIELHHTMRRIRTFEERVGEMFVRQCTAGSMLHLSVGEEGVAGICAEMAEDDSFTAHHRGHGIFLARGGEPHRMFAEIGGRQAGYCAGKGGSMHIADIDLGHLGANAIVGGGIPHAVGAALTYRTKKLDRVSVAFFGDGAMQQGILHESMNLAALWSLPVLFVCINNRYGMGTRIDRASASTNFVALAEAIGLRGREVDGSDVEAVAECAKAMMNDARSGTPGLLTMNCYRFYGHARMDKSPYRDEEEEFQGRQQDPIARARERLVEKGLATVEVLDLADDGIAKEMDSALEWAISQPPASPAAIFSDVYGEGEPAPVPVRARLLQILGESRS